VEKTCHVRRFETPVRCVTIDVPRNYDAPNGATMKVTAVIVPATTARPAPDPLIMLAGGPGQAATDMGGLLAPLVNVRRKRDIILFDVRGTGLSGPLDCAGYDRQLEQSSTADAMTQLRGLVAACRAALGDRVRFHTSREITEDLERFRRAMKYERINLWGGSFGTRIAQHYVRAYGAHARAVVLDAIAPAGESILATGARSPDDSLKKMFAACAAQASCAKAFPNLAADFDALLARADKAASVTAISPRTGAPLQVTFNYPVLSNAVRLAFYSGSSASLLPYAIHEGAKGNFGPFLGILGGAPSGVHMGAQYSGICAEDWWQASQGPAATRSGGFMRDGFFQFFTPACAIWPDAHLPAPMLATFKSDVPALGISGAWDPVTPPALGARALAQFRNAVHVVVPNGFHTNTGNPCIVRIIASFLDDPVQGGRDHKCVAASFAPPHFFANGAY
jgi:pimeloyl-ACP methyl ester carboxylesterase